MKGADILKFIKGQHVIYNGAEICSIGDIVKKDFDGTGDKDYIILNPLELNTTFYVPYKKADEMIHPLLSKESLLELIDKMGTNTDVCRSSTESRNINIRDALKEGNHEVIIEIMNEIYCEKINREKSGKQLYKTDKRNFELAKRLIDSEIAVSFGIEINEVEEFINRKINKQGLN